MGRAQVFISHSTKTVEAELYLSALIQAFGDEGNLEFLGAPFWLERKDVEPGDLWRSKIFEALEEAHAAVLLLSKEAVRESNYVKIEASYLTVRSVNRFPLVLVLIDVTVEDFLQGVWRELDVTARQVIQNCNPKEAAQKTLEFLRRHLDLDRIAPRNLKERLRGAIANDLRRAQVGRDDILMLVDEIGELAACQQDAPSRDDRDARRWLASVLIDAPPQLLETVLRKLKDNCTDDTRPLVSILNRIAPRWVDEQTANVIGFLARGRPADRNFAISLANEWTLQAYVCRARACRYGESTPLQYAAPAREEEGESFERDAEAIERFVLERAGLDPARKDLKKIYFDQQEEEWPVVVSLQEDWWPPHPSLLAALRNRLEKVAFRFSPALDRQGVEAIPLLANPSAESENDAFIRHARIQNMLRKL